VQLQHLIILFIMVYPIWLGNFLVAYVVLDAGGLGDARDGLPELGVGGNGAISMPSALGDGRLCALALVNGLLGQAVRHRHLLARDGSLLRINLFHLLDPVRGMLRRLELGILVEVLLLHPVLPLRNLVDDRDVRHRLILRMIRLLSLIRGLAPRHMVRLLDPDRAVLLDGFESGGGGHQIPDQVMQRIILLGIAIGINIRRPMDLG
jgi:hypothetical protein